MKIVSITDLHIRYKTPEARNDKYFLDTIFQKLEYVFHYAWTNDAQYIVCGGDVFDLPVFDSYQPIIKLQLLLEKYRALPFITTVGQHDTRAHVSSLYENCALGVVESTGLVKVLYNGERYSPREDLEFVGYGFNDDATKELLKGNQTHKWKDNSIALIHASISGADSQYATAISNYDFKGFDFAVLGDIHEGFAPYTMKSGCVAFNTGALIRKQYDERARIPYFCVMCTDTGTATFHSIPCGQDNFHPQRENNKEIDTALETKRALMIAKNASITDPYQRVHHTGQTLELSEHVIDRTLGEMRKNDK